MEDENVSKIILIYKIPNNLTDNITCISNWRISTVAEIYPNLTSLDMKAVGILLT
jgi:hypothetical protein